MLLPDVGKCAKDAAFQQESKPVNGLGMDDTALIFVTPMGNELMRAPLVNPMAGIGSENSEHQIANVGMSNVGVQNYVVALMRTGPSRSAA